MVFSMHYSHKHNLLRTMAFQSSGNGKVLAQLEPVWARNPFVGPTNAVTIVAFKSRWQAAFLTLICYHVGLFSTQLYSPPPPPPRKKYNNNRKTCFVHSRERQSFSRALCPISTGHTKRSPTRGGAAFEHAFDPIRSDRRLNSSVRRCSEASKVSRRAPAWDAGGT